jgi:hypothetical protein
MNELFGFVSDLPLFYLVPLLVFGPVFLLILYNLSLKDIVNPSPEMREERRRMKEMAERIADERNEKRSASGPGKRAAANTPLQWAGQAITYMIFALIIAIFSNTPLYVANPPEMAEIKLSFTHAGKRKEKCRKRTPEELRKLAENMRTAMTCPRRRWPVTTDLMVDGAAVFHGVAQPAGLSKDSHSTFYEAFTVSAGTHRIRVRILDSGQYGEGVDYDYVLEEEVVLSPSEILVIGFDNDAKRITLE